MSFPDTLDIVCPFCDWEFKFSRNLRQHCRKEHKDSLSGIAHFSELQDNVTKQNLQQRSTVQQGFVSLQQGSTVQQELVSLQQGSTVQQELVSLQQGSTVQQELVSLQQESTVQQELISLQQESIVQQELVSLPRRFPCKNCDKVFLTKYTLKRHKKEKHVILLPEDLHCVFCHKGSFKDPRCRKWYQRSCSYNPNKQTFSCIHCNKEYHTKLNLKSHMKTSTLNTVNICTYNYR